MKRKRFRMKHFTDDDGKAIDVPLPQRMAYGHLKNRGIYAKISLNCNPNLKTSKAPLKSQAQGTSLFMHSASNQRVVQRIVHGRLKSGCQKVRGGRLGVKAGVVYAERGEKEDQVGQGKSF